MLLRRICISFFGLLVTSISFCQADPQQAKEMQFDCGKVKCSAYLLEPDKPGRYPAIVYLHWLGSPNGNKHEFLPEAEQLRSKGAVALLVDMPWAEPKWFGKRKLEQDFQMSIQIVEKIDAALDLVAN